MYIYYRYTYRYTCRTSDVVPHTLAMVGDVVDEDEVFLHRPWAFPHFSPLAAAYPLVHVPFLHQEGGNKEKERQRGDETRQ